MAFVTELGDAQKCLALLYEKGKLRIVEYQVLDRGQPVTQQVHLYDRHTVLGAYFHCHGTTKTPLYKHLLRVGSALSPVRRHLENPLDSVLKIHGQAVADIVCTMTIPYSSKLKSRRARAASSLLLPLLCCLRSCQHGHGHNQDDSFKDL